MSQITKVFFTLLTTFTLCSFSYAGGQKNSANLKSNKIHRQTDIQHQYSRAIYPNKKHNKSLIPCLNGEFRLSKPEHYVIASVLFLGVAITALELGAYTPEKAQTTTLPYRFQTIPAPASILTSNSTNPLSPPLIISHETLNAPPCSLSEKPTFDHRFLHVVRPGQIDHAPFYNSIQEASEALYQEHTKNGHCKVDKEEIVCSVSIANEKIVLLDGKLNGRSPFEQAIYHQAWRHLEQNYLAPHSANPIGALDTFFAPEQFRHNLALLNSLIITGENQESSLRPLENGAGFYLQNNLYSFEQVELWAEIVQSEQPHLFDYYKEIEDIALDLSRHLKEGPQFLRNRHQELVDEYETLPLQSQMSLAFKFAAYSDMFDTNLFLRENFLYIQAYSENDYAELLEDLRKNTQILWQHDPIKAAAYFLPRFTQIKPFHRGNGRLARLILNFILHAHGYEPAMFFSNKQYTQMYQASWSRQMYLPLELITRAQNRQTLLSATTPFEIFLRQTLCHQKEYQSYFSGLFDTLKNCGKKCQVAVDAYILKTEQPVIVKN